MKYIKKYEDLNNEPKIGDYVICTSIYNKYEPLLEFLSNNVGEIIVPEFKFTTFNFKVRYDNVPKNLRTNNFNGDDYRLVSREEILYWSSNREELEAMLKSKKYNL